MTEQKQIGNATLTVADEEFARGYHVGYLRYLTDGQSKERVTISSLLARQQA